MSIYLIIVFIIIIAAAIGVAMWFVLRSRRSTQTKETVKEPTKEIRKPEKETIKPEKLPFRWSYIMLPLIILFLAIALSAYFYPRLPAEVAIQLKFEETPTRWLSRELAMVLTLAPQILLTLLAAGTTWLITKFGILSRQTVSTKIKPERILWLMSNIPALPQGVLCFTMFNIFFYNSFQTQLMPTWAFILTVIGVASVIIVLFFSAIFRARRKATPQPEEPGDTNNA